MQLLVKMLESVNLLCATKICKFMIMVLYLVNHSLIYIIYWLITILLNLYSLLSQVNYRSSAANIAATFKDVQGNMTNSTMLEGLRKFVEYEIRVLAYTRMGDGVLSSPEVKVQTLPDGKLCFLIDNDVLILLMLRIPLKMYHVQGIESCWYFVKAVRHNIFVSFSIL